MPKKSSQYYGAEPTSQGHGVLMVAPRVERKKIQPMPGNRGRSSRSAFDVQQNRAQK